MITCDVKMLRNFTEYLLCPRTEKTLPLRKAKEAQAAVNRKKGREITRFCSII